MVQLADELLHNVSMTLGINGSNFGERSLLLFGKGFDFFLLLGKVPGVANDLLTRQQWRPLWLRRLPPLSLLPPLPLPL